jgi:hypothetical protein
MKVNGSKTSGKAVGLSFTRMGTYTWGSLTGVKPKVRESTFGRTGKHTRVNGTKDESTDMACGKAQRETHM